MSGSQVWIRPISVRLLAVMRNNSDFTTRIFGNSNGHHIDYCHIVRGTLGYLLAWLSNSGNIYYRQFVDTAPIVCGKVYVTVRCPSVCPSVCLSQLSTAAAACGGFASVGPADRIYSVSTDCCTAGAQQHDTAAAGHTTARRSAAKAIGVTFIATVRGWTQLFLNSDSVIWWPASLSQW